MIIRILPSNTLQFSASEVEGMLSYSTVVST